MCARCFFCRRPKKDGTSECSSKTLSGSRLSKLTETNSRILKNKNRKSAKKIIGPISSTTETLVEESDLTTSTAPTNNNNDKPHSFHDLRFGGGDTLVHVELADDIYKYLRHVEKSVQIGPNFLRGKKIDASMREILVDWLMRLQLDFELSTETLHLTVFIMDRALIKMDVVKENLQLLGATSMFIAAKFEEIYLPDIGEFVTGAANLFSAKDMLKMERLILTALNFRLACSYTIQFLRRYSALAVVDTTTHNLAKFIAEVAFLDYSIAHLLSSKIAAVSVYLAHVIQRLKLPTHLYTYMETSERELIPLSQKFVTAIKRLIRPDSKLHSLKRKLEKLYPNNKPDGLHSFDELLRKNWAVSKEVVV